jgi:hypothetical protein
LPILIILTCLNIGFIWWNSFQTIGDSYAASDTVGEAVKSVAEPVMNLFESDSGTVFGYDYMRLIRKGAHVLEFMTLGILLVLLNAAEKRVGVFAILFVALSVGVIDETIQRYTGRTSQVKDIVIDFAGALAGMAIAAIIMLIIKRTGSNTGEI